MTNAAVFWDDIAEKYSKDPIRDMEGYAFTLMRTKSYLRGHHEILEVGCGTGSTALELAGDVSKITATDISTKMIEIAKSKAADQSIGNVSFKSVAMMGDHGPVGQFDAVLAHNLLHLVENPKAAVKHMAGYLKPGGLLITKTPCLGNKKWLFAPMIKVMQVFGKAPLVKMHKISQMDQMIVDAGFEILEKNHKKAFVPNRYIVARKK